MNTLTRRVATAATAGALVLGGAVATASTASAASSKTCAHSVKLTTHVDATVKFRTGPSGAAKGQLSKNTRIYYACSKGNWGYVKALSGAHKGENGWVSRDYISIPMQLD